MSKTVTQWLRLARRKPTDNECVACFGVISTDYGCDPTPLCHHCAQEALQVVAFKGISR